MEENDIRPKDLFKRYLELSQADACSFDPGSFVSIDCPACGSSLNDLKIIKFDFRYVICKQCGSLYCSPRPSSEVLADYYANSSSSKYWSSVFFPAVAEKRRELLFRPKAARFSDLLLAEQRFPKSICDVGAGYGVFLEELRTFFPEAELYAVEPSPELAKICRAKGIETLESTGENASASSGKFDLVISQEVLEHVFSPLDFVRGLSELTTDGGLCIVTSLGFEGFDILSLMERSNSVFPPHHLNFLSIEGFDTLFKRAGFRSIKISTPGELDVSIVANSDSPNEFVRVLGKREGAIAEFRSFLQKHRLSSHIWICSEK